MDAAIATVLQIKRQNPRTSWRDKRTRRKGPIIYEEYGRSFLVHAHLGDARFLEQVELCFRSAAHDGVVALSIILQSVRTKFTQRVVGRFLITRTSGLLACF
jgi:hypothetical protein